MYIMWIYFVFYGPTHVETGYFRGENKAPEEDRQLNVSVVRENRDER